MTYRKVLLLLVLCSFISCKREVPIENEELLKTGTIDDIFLCEYLDSIPPEKKDTTVLKMVLVATGKLPYKKH